MLINLLSIASKVKVHIHIEVCVSTEGIALQYYFGMFLAIQYSNICVKFIPCCCIVMMWLLPMFPLFIHWMYKNSIGDLSTLKANRLVWFRWYRWSSILKLVIRKAVFYCIIMWYHVSYINSDIVQSNIQCYQWAGPAWLISYGCWATVTL